MKCLILMKYSKLDIFSIFVFKISQIFDMLIEEVFYYESYRYK